MKKESYISCIKIRGMTILPPLMDDSRIEEMRKYKNEAIELEKRLAERKIESLDLQEPLDIDDNNEFVNLTNQDVNILNNLGEVIQHHTSIIDDCFNEITNKTQHLVNSSTIGDLIQISSGNNTPCPESLESLVTVINLNNNNSDEELQDESDLTNNQENQTTALALIDNFYEERQKLIGYLNQNFLNYFSNYIDEDQKLSRPQTLSLRSSTSEILKSSVEYSNNKNVVHGSSSLSNLFSISNIPSSSSVTERSLLKSDATKDSGYDARTYQVDEDLSTDTEIDNDLQSEVFQQCIISQKEFYENNIINEQEMKNNTICANSPETQIVLLEKKYGYLRHESQENDLESPPKTNTHDSYSMIDQSVTLSEISSSPKDISDSSDIKEKTDQSKGEFIDCDTERKRRISHCSTSTASLIEQKDATTWIPENEFKRDISHRSTSTPTKLFCNKLVQANIDDDNDIEKMNQSEMLNNNKNTEYVNVELSISPTRNKQGKCQSVFEYIEKLLEFGKSSQRPYFEPNPGPLEKCTSAISWKSCQSDYNENEINGNTEEETSNLLNYSPSSAKTSKSTGDIISYKSAIYPLSPAQEPERDPTTPKLVRQGSYILDAPSPLLSAHIQTCGIVGPKESHVSRELFPNKSHRCWDKNDEELREASDPEDLVFDAEAFVSDKTALLEERKRMEAAILAEASRLKLSPDIIEESHRRRQAEWVQRRAAAEALAEAKSRRETAAATRIVATAKGFLVRRLFRTEHVQSLIRTIKDTVACAMSLHETDTVTREDVELHKRLIMQLNSAVCNIHELFLESSSYDQMQIIAQDRARIMARKRSRSSSETSAQQRFLSSATERTLKRKSQDRSRPSTSDTQTPRADSPPSLSLTSPPLSSCSSRRTWSFNEPPRSLPPHNRPSQTNVPICDSARLISGCLTRSFTSQSSRRESSNRKSSIRRSRSSTRKPWR